MDLEAEIPRIYTEVMEQWHRFMDRLPPERRKKFEEELGRRRTQLGRNEC